MFSGNPEMRKINNFVPRFDQSEVPYCTTLSGGRAASELGERGAVGGGVRSPVSPTPSSGTCWRVVRLASAEFTNNA